MSLRVYGLAFTPRLGRKECARFRGLSFGLRVSDLGFMVWGVVFSGVHPATGKVGEGHTLGVPLARLLKFDLRIQGFI